MDGLIKTAGQIFKIMDGCWQLHRVIKNTIVNSDELAYNWFFTRRKQEELNTTDAYRVTSEEVRKFQSIDYNLDKEYKGCGYAEFFNSDIDSVKLYKENLRLENINTKLLIWSKQEYKYSYNKQNEVITKYFSDGKIFYNLKFTEDAIYGIHRCINDQYESRYLFTDKKNFSITYIVYGPKKKYTIISRYTKID